ncbi:MAG: emp24/gp25L/p24 family protein [Burkholderiales bacterium]|nr:emp24/gp25L/p24 family protein [Burkholderiales bacterium]
MSREVSEVTRRVFLAVAVMTAMAGAPAMAQQNQAALTATVPAGTHKTLRLRNLPKDAQIAVAVRATGRVMVTFLTEADFKRYPNPEEPVFAAPVERQLSFALVMPETGNYYVVFDNTKGTEERKVQMVIRAARGAAQVPAPANPATPGSVVPPGPPPPTQPKAQQHDM